MIGSRGVAITDWRERALSRAAIVSHKKKTTVLSSLLVTVALAKMLLSLILLRWHIYMQKSRGNSHDAMMLHVNLHVALKQAVMECRPLSAT